MAPRSPRDVALDQVADLQVPKRADDLAEHPRHRADALPLGRERSLELRGDPLQRHGDDDVEIAADDLEDIALETAVESSRPGRATCPPGSWGTVNDSGPAGNTKPPRRNVCAVPPT